MTSRKALTRPSLQPTTPALREAPGIAKLPPKPTTQVSPLGPLSGHFAGPSSGLFSTASTTTTVFRTSSSLTQPSAQPIKQLSRSDTLPSSGWGQWGTKGGDIDDISGDVDQPMEDVLGALTIPQAEMLQASLSMSSSQPSTPTEQPSPRPQSAITTEAQTQTKTVAAPISSSV